jgi:hypothetical protein
VLARHSSTFPRFPQGMQATDAPSLMDPWRRGVVTAVDKSSMGGPGACLRGKAVAVFPLRKRYMRAIHSLRSNVPDVSEKDTGWRQREKGQPLQLRL